MPDTLKKGDPIKVRLTRRHELDGELVDHPAKFVRYQPGQTGWADVDLEVAHSIYKGEKVKRLSVPVSQIIAALLLLALFVFPAKAQEPQTVSLQTVSQTLAQNATCTGSAQSFQVQNLGQISHQATALSVAPSFTLEIDGGDSITTTYRISNPAISFANAGSVSYIAQGYGYYAVETVVVTCTPASTFSLSYSGGQTGFSSLIGPPGGSIANGGLTNEVQGLVAPGASSTGINPLLEGGIAPPINSGLTGAGLDNFTAQSTNVAASFVGTVTEATVPALQQNGKEFAVSFDMHGGNGSTQQATVVAPWTSESGFGNCGPPASSSPCVTFLNNVNSGQIFQRNYQNNGAQNAHTDMVGILTFTGTATAAIRQGSAVTAASVSFPSNTLSGSTLAAAVFCNSATPCSNIGLTDTQGNVWKQVTLIIALPANSISTLSLWVSSSLSSAAADTLTFTTGAGAIFSSAVVEITNLSPSNLTSPSTFMNVDALGNSVVRLDAQAPNQFTCNVTLSTATTTQMTGCGAPTTINGQPVRIYVTDVQVNTTSAGAGSTLQLVTGTGANCATGVANLSAITYSGAAVGLQSFLGFRTPLVAPLQSAVCGKQTGASPSTSVIEVHGFLAP